MTTYRFHTFEGPRDKFACIKCKAPFSAETRLQECPGFPPPPPEPRRELRMFLTPESTNIAMIMHHGETDELEVEFNNGGRYRYAKVPLEVYEALRRAESVGRSFDLLVKKAGYEFERVGTVLEMREQDEIAPPRALDAEDFWMGLTEQEQEWAFEAVKAHEVET